MTDEQLLTRAKAGDFSAFAGLVDRHAAGVYTLARRVLRNAHDAEDVVQTTWLKALEHLGTFREESSFQTWLRRIAMNTSLNILRKHRGLPMSAPLGGNDHDEYPAHGPEDIREWREDAVEQAQRREVREQLDHAVAELDEKHRLVFVLRDIEGMSVEETAGALGISTSNVKVRLMRARLKLRERLTGVFGQGPGLKPAGHDHSGLSTHRG